MKKRHRSTMLKVLLLVGAPVFVLSACSSIGGFVMENTLDQVACHNECPGGPGEKECIEKCRERLSAERRGREQRKRDEEFRKTYHEPHQFPAALDPVRQLNR